MTWLRAEPFFAPYKTGIPDNLNLVIKNESFHTTTNWFRIKAIAISDLISFKSTWL